MPSCQPERNVISTHENHQATGHPKKAKTGLSFLPVHLHAQEEYQASWQLCAACSSPHANALAAHCSEASPRAQPVTAGLNQSLSDAHLHLLFCMLCVCGVGDIPSFPSRFFVVGKWGIDIVPCLLARLGWHSRCRTQDPETKLLGPACRVVCPCVICRTR